MDDESAVRAVLLRYGSALDDRDAEGVLACFTDDVRLEYFNGEMVTDGIDAARGFFSFDGRAGLPGLDRIARTTHLWNVMHVEIDGDTAHSTTACIAHLLGVVGEDAVLVTRGLRYVDDLRRAAGGWRISHRRHQPEWETRTPAVSSLP